MTTSKVPPTTNGAEDAQLKPAHVATALRKENGQYGIMWHQPIPFEAFQNGMAKLFLGPTDANASERTVPKDDGDEWDGKRAYNEGRGDYECAMLKGGKNWKLFGELSAHEQAYWIARAAKESCNRRQATGVADDQSIQDVESPNSKD